MNDLTISGYEGSIRADDRVRRPSSTGVPTDTASFQQLLTYLVVSSFNPSANPANDMGSLLSPLVLLLEQLQAQQLFAQAPLPEGIEDVSALAQESRVESTYPVHGRLTQKFHPGHNGMDLGVKVGTPVRSTIEGSVTYAGWNNQGYGNLVIVDNGTYKTYYAHLSEIPVTVGQTVHQGEVIGLSGNTGNSTGPHLHYEVRKHNNPMDPAIFHSHSI